jgi:spore cortex formation protein SpoVR/YcgB (stage V sporulation)
MTDRKLSLIDTTEEEQESLVHSTSDNTQDAPSSTLMDSTHAITDNNTAATMTPTSEEAWEDNSSKKDEHPLASLSLEEYETTDPWATQPESNALLKEEEEEEEPKVIQPVVATTTAVVDQPEETQQPEQPEVLDTDTSAIKVTLAHKLGCLC